MPTRRLSRRDFIKTTLGGAGLLGIGALLDACNYDLATNMPAADSPTPALENPTLEPPASTATSTPEASPPATDTVPAPTETPAAPPDIAVARGGEPEDLVRRAIAALGGMEAFVQPGTNVVIKPNVCVAYRSYEYAATTNPWLVGALVKMAFEAGAASVKVMDLPFNGTQSQAYIDSGVQEQVEAAGGEMIKTISWKYVETANPAGQYMKKFSVYEDVLNADVLINVPIAKNHTSEARLTLGMKNLMGVITQADRNSMHYSLVKSIADLAALVRPQLTIVDAVRILTANGPRGGRLADVQKLDTVIASRDIVAADSYATSLFGMTPADIKYIEKAAALGVGRSDLENLRIAEV